MEGVGGGEQGGRRKRHEKEPKGTQILLAANSDAAAHTKTLRTDLLELSKRSRRSPDHQQEPKGSSQLRKTL